ncbi:OsmC family protein [Leptospira sp. 2 VSF19]|uniref:OsmC family protein n=1 Tax=Leptospira soteropolitanensis TaxID=2950025 RepID=A0AAW5VJS5_9LEPT|nr:OsmC family protein [Leptospira soteropolitanensis]MCW7491288.1 OsmC family protein [Leptospira soteropolitanensis]MCW7498873.1 OsmC family protein [Leptospira soteropolitanensis]MCW7521535.1 OsmC family protein [Leptospira soteropolitanensis]MCW7524976.1 OsmC family protein [Leptospira soteropolitanensis]MCW7528844.1 OsmC family protein [Leptospira soteropolitanensis]
MTAVFEDKVVVSTTKTKYETKISAGKHHWIADEPKDKEGTDLGPMPTELLASSLGACTSITIRMYADRKEYPLDSVEVHVTIDKRSLEDHKFTRVVFLSGNLSIEQRERLLSVANACPVHKILSGKIEIETALG